MPRQEIRKSPSKHDADRASQKDRGYAEADLFNLHRARLSRSPRGRGSGAARHEPPQPFEMPQLCQSSVLPKHPASCDAVRSHWTPQIEIARHLAMPPSIVLSAGPESRVDQARKGLYGESRKYGIQPFFGARFHSQSCWQRSLLFVAASLSGLQGFPAPSWLTCLREFAAI